MFYYCCFVFEYVYIVKLLYEVIESGKEFLWIEVCDKGFCILKENFVLILVLVFLIFDGMLIFDRDVSGVVIGVFFL